MAHQLRIVVHPDVPRVEGGLYGRDYIRSIAADVGMEHAIDQLDTTIMNDLVDHLIRLENIGMEEHHRKIDVIRSGLSRSIRSGNADAVELFVRMGADPNYAHYPMFHEGDDDAIGILPLLWQARTAAVVERLIALGADPNRAHPDTIGFLTRPEEFEDDDSYMGGEDVLVHTDALAYLFLRGSVESFVAMMPHARFPNRLLQIVDDYPTAGLHREQKMAAVNHLRRTRECIQESAQKGKKWLRRRWFLTTRVFTKNIWLPYGVHNTIVDFLFE